MRARPAVLVIAGTDSSGGAGLTRDVAVLTELGVDAVPVVTAVTAQSDSRVTAVHHVPADTVRAQITAALTTRRVGAVKIGMLGTRAIVEAVAECLPSPDAVPIVLDPVLLASSGGVLLDPEGCEAMRVKLFPRVTLLTPNVPEAASILGEQAAGSETALISQARRLVALGPAAVLLKGGHAAGDEAVDWLIARDQPVLRIASPRVATSRRGTGCSLASAIAGSLASGTALADACRRAKDYLRDYLTDSS